MNTCCALALLIPTRLSSDIEDVRRQHDKAYDRWMPHINFLFPFVQENKIPDFAKRLTDELSKLSPFIVNLSEIGSFSQPLNNNVIQTFHLKSNDETKMLELYAAVRRAIPDFKPQRNDFVIKHHAIRSLLQSRSSTSYSRAMEEIGEPYGYITKYIFRWNLSVGG